MSSMWKNAVKKRDFRERAQPNEREKWGLLEKHKDYSLRAKDYNAKKQRLKALRRKAEERNPDEFHFAMMNSQTHSGGTRTATRGNRVLDHEITKLMKTQDAGYLRNAAQRAKRSRERLEEELLVQHHIQRGTESATMDGHEAGRRRLVFVDSINDQVRGPRADAELEPLPMAGISSRLNLNTEHTITNATSGSPTQLSQQSSFPRMRNEKASALDAHRLAALKRREHDLIAAGQELESQRSNIANTRGSGVNRAGVRFKIKGRKK